jgi:hypothetical protein
LQLSANSSFVTPLAQRSTMRERNAKPCAVVRRRVHRSIVWRSYSVAASRALRRPRVGCMLGPSDELDEALWGLHALPAGLFIAAGCVIISRLSDFQPGHLYGVVCVAVFTGALAKHEQGHAVAISTLITVIVAVAAWFAWVPVNAAAVQSGASWPLIVLDDVLGAVFTGGLIGSTMGMIPLRFLPGGALAAWHRGVWRPSPGRSRSCSSRSCSTLGVAAIRDGHRP